MYSINGFGGVSVNRLMQLLMQIQCNHSQKQTGNELLGTIVKVNQQSNTEYKLLILRDKKINPYYF